MRIGSRRLVRLVPVLFVVLLGLSALGLLPVGIGPQAVHAAAPTSDCSSTSPFGTGAAILLTALSADAYHLAVYPGIVSLAVVFVAFAAMTYVGFHTGKLWPIIVAHVLNNAAVFTFSVLALAH